MKEEEKEKLHLEQQQHYYTSLRKKICEIHYSIITRLIDCWMRERDYGRNIMWIPVILIEHFFPPLKAKKRNPLLLFFCATPFLSVIAMQDEIVVNNEESRFFMKKYFASCNRWDQTLLLWFWEVLGSYYFSIIFFSR